MKVVKIKFSAFGRLTHLGFVAKANTIFIQLQDNNLVFNLTVGELTALQEAIESLSGLTLAAASEAGSKIIRDNRDSQAAIVLNMLIQTGINKVLPVALTKTTFEDQRAVVTLAGYPLSSDTHIPAPLEKVTDVEVENSGAPGEPIVNVKWKRNKAAAYIVQTFPGLSYDQSSVWTDRAFCTTSKYQLSLPTGTWSIRVIAVSGTARAQASTPAPIVVG